MDAILNARKTRLTGLPYAAGATTLNLDSNVFSDAEADFNLVIYDRTAGDAADARTAGRMEIVRVDHESMNGNEITVTRAQEGTTAIEFDDGGLWDVVMGPTKKVFDDIRKKYVTPEDFGAVGDGDSDDTEALNAWANAVGLKYGTPGAIYKLSGNLTLPANSFFDFSGATIRCDQGFVGDGMINIPANRENIVLMNLTLDGNEVNEHVIRVQEAKRIKLSAIHITNGRQNTSTSHCARFFFSEDIVLTNWTVQNSEAGDIIRLFQCDNVHLESLRTIGLVRGRLIGVGTSRDVKIHDVLVSRHEGFSGTDMCFYTSLCDKISFSDCIITEQGVGSQHTKISRGTTNFSLDNCSTILYTTTQNLAFIRIEGGRYGTLNNCNVHDVNYQAGRSGNQPAIWLGPHSGTPSDLEDITVKNCTARFSGRGITIQNRLDFNNKNIKLINNDIISYQEVMQFVDDGDSFDFLEMLGGTYHSINDRAVSVPGGNRMPSKFRMRGVVMSSPGAGTGNRIFWTNGIGLDDWELTSNTFECTDTGSTGQIRIDGGNQVALARNILKNVTTSIVSMSNTVEVANTTIPRI